jgi:hypothetical protein
VALLAAMVEVDEVVVVAGKERVSVVVERPGLA